MPNSCGTVNYFTLDRIRLNVLRVLPGFVELFIISKFSKGYVSPTVDCILSEENASIEIEIIYGL